MAWAAIRRGGRSGWRNASATVTSTTTELTCISVSGARPASSGTWPSATNSSPNPVPAARPSRTS